MLCEALEESLFIEEHFIKNVIVEQKVENRIAMLCIHLFIKMNLLVYSTTSIGPKSWLSIYGAIAGF